jgi:hypothetical protein
MKKSIVLLVLVSTMVIQASLSFNALATCATCGVEEDWASSANNFLEGKPINDTPSSLSNPQRYRQTNSDFNSSLLKEGTGNPTGNSINTGATSPLNASTLDIILKDINAMPNPVTSGKPVMITTSFGNNSSNSQGIPVTNMTVYASIKNSAGLEVGKVILQPSSAGEYAGIWTANPTAGVYKVTIVAAASGASKPFNDALQIDVSKAA